MTPEQRKVKEFHEAFGLLVNDRPTVPGGVPGVEKTTVLRHRLIAEELDEFDAACWDGDVVAVADALADLLYVVYGAAVSFGIDMEPVFNEVHRSNMTKVGGHKDEGGKWVKPKTYTPPDLAPILIRQGCRHLRTHRGLKMWKVSVPDGTPIQVCDDCGAFRYFWASDDSGWIYPEDVRKVVAEATAVLEEGNVGPGGGGGQ